MAEKARAFITISGRVQGVGFRYYTKRQAQQLGLQGYVKNLRNGDVEVEAEGDKETLKEFISSLRSGPSSARVSNLNVDWLNYENKYNNFSVKF